MAGTAAQFYGSMGARLINNNKEHHAMRIDKHLQDDLLLLNVINHKTRGDWPHRQGYYTLNLSQARLMGLSKSTAYRWVAKPPAHFRAMLERLAFMERRFHNARMLPESWQRDGWWFDSKDQLVYGSNYTNPYRDAASEVIGARFKELGLLQRLGLLRRERDQALDEARRYQAANDPYFYHG